MESVEAFGGRRLCLARKGEEQNPDFIDALRRKSYAMSQEDADFSEYLVYCHIDRVRQLIVTGE